jgi:hypothetical protein
VDKSLDYSKHIAIKEALMEKMETNKIKEVVHMEGSDTEDMNKRLVDAEFKIWKKIEDIAYAVGEHPDEVYAGLMIQFSEFIEKKYPTKEYPSEKSAEEHIQN